ncbi:AAA family ATPase [Granulicatella sp. zg-ZJ]|uniref:AAA family ATPase n=1 Tax=Granulicatella sp. zg-ZJ TaxID=2678504 RepID=UPI0013D127AB|nr:AAA family ATPase [Granulicatella sp. zg-ZJ]NEW63366.1 AAA family ATPase [Granulicatella sp. zg-ZJ]
MSKKLYLKLLGDAQVFLDDKPILFSFAKIHALLYYVLVNKHVSRDEMAGVLWADKTEKGAKKNLRNTIYQANKVLGDDYIVSPNKSVLTLNESLMIESDIDLFLKNPVKHLDLYGGEFLKGFFLKDAEMFDLWVIKTRQYYEQKFVQACYQKIQTDIEYNDTQTVEKNIRRLIEIDEFDERNYQLLMSYYKDKGLNGKVVETYYELSNSLERELGISPSKETREIYEQTLMIVDGNKRKKDNRTLFFGRTKEIEFLEKNVHFFFEQKEYKNILIKGDIGSGKSVLVEQVLHHAKKKGDVLSVQCYQVEKHYPLRCFRIVVEEIFKLLEEKAVVTQFFKEKIYRFFPTLSDYEQDAILNNELSALSQLICELLYKITENQKIILFIKDIQWMDKESFSLLTSLMLRLHSQKILWLFTMRREEQEYIDRFINTMTMHHQLDTLMLLPLNFEETQSFSKKYLPNKVLSNDIVEQLYDETQGNIFFLTEYLNALKVDAKLDYMSLKMQDAIKNRFAYLTTNEREIVYFISFFDRPVSLSFIAKVLEKDVSSVVDSVDSLVKQYILKSDIEQEDIVVIFTHKKLKEFLYQNQSVAKKHLMHGRIARLLEMDIDVQTADISVLSLISYHYQQARQELESLYYRLLCLQNQLKIQNELFPIYSDKVPLKEYPIKISQEDIFLQFQDIKEKIERLKEQYNGHKLYQTLVLKSLYLEGRYFIFCAEYEKGLEAIHQVILKAKMSNDTEYVLEGYRQIIHYYIQLDDAENMQRYIELAINAATQANNHEFIGILLRLKGLYHLMSGDLDTAINLFYQSISTLTITDYLKEKYSLNIAAAYDYLSEVESIKGNYENAVLLLEKSINIAISQQSPSSLVVFYTNMGVILYMMEDYERSKYFLLKAKQLYSNTFSSLWKEVQLNAHIALIALKERDTQTVYRFLKENKTDIKLISNKRDIGFIYYVKAITKHEMDRGLLVDKHLETLLRQPFGYYKEQALKYLSPNRDVSESKLLKMIN